MKLLIKEAIKKIKLTFGRFLSVFFIVALGVGFFAGIRNTCDDMLYTASSYYKDKNLMDLRLVSTLGFTDEDIKIIKNIKGVKDAEASHYIDCLESSHAIRVLGITEKINKTTLVEGRMPQKENEVLADMNVYQVGDKLTLDTKDLKEKQVEVVGTIKSPMYIQFNNKGTTLIGNGKISGFIYTLEDNFSIDVYTVVYLTGTKTTSLQSYTKEYDIQLEELQKEVEKNLEKLKTRRYDEIKKEAEDKITEAKTKIANEKEKYQSQLKAAKQKLDATNKKLQKADKELNSKEKLLEEKEKQALQELSQAKESLEKAKGEYQLYLEQYKQYKTYLDYLTYISKYDKIPNFKEMSYEEILEYFEGLTEEEIQDFITYIQNGNLEIKIPDINFENKEEVRHAIENLFNNEIIQEIKNGISIDSEENLLEQLNKIFENIATKLKQAEEEIKTAETLIKQKEQLLNAEIQKGKKSLAMYRSEISDGYQKLESGYETYFINYDKFELQFSDAYQKVEMEIKKVEEIEKPTIYTFTRKDNAGYEDYKSDATRVNNISKVFPVFFLLVAALVCLNTMSRMVEEDRGQMGIYKSLGFNNRQILFTYILYATFATIFGSIVGLLLGCTILPSVIYNIYSFMYILPNLKFDNNIVTMFLTTVLMFAVTLSITLYTALSVLKGTPASLLRPKAPAKGKKVLIEKIGFIWKRLNFSFKVTTRNIFRYKKRIFMTIIGIAGCTALTLAGLGLKDSITGIVKIQFNEITKYKAMLVLDKSYEKFEEETKELLNENNIKDPTLIYQELYNYKIKDKSNEVYLVVPSEKEELKEYITLRHREDKKEIDLADDGAIITEKMAINLNVKIGDVISIYDTNNTQYKVKVKEITENYAYNYIYLTKAYYKQVFHKNVTYNMVISDIEEKANTDQISSQLLDTKKVLNVSFVNDILEKFNDMVTNLNRIVFVILICSCLLAFIVLYNLTTINITERIREIATLKVLGFNDFEVSMYVYRETIILTVFGAFVGLILGILLHQFVITSAEMEFIMFQRNINGMSYIYAFIITMVFSLIISIFTHFKLKKVNMIEALKSVE